MKAELSLKLLGSAPYFNQETFKIYLINQRLSRIRSLVFQFPLAVP